MQQNRNSDERIANQSAEWLARFLVGRSYEVLDFRGHACAGLGVSVTTAADHMGINR